MKTRKLLRYIFIIPSLLYLFSFFVPIDGEKISKPSSQAIYSRDGEPLRVFLSPDEKWRIPVNVEDVSPCLMESFIAIEDKCFHYHNGVNPYALLRALCLNIKQRKIVSGGSTITMQVARMMEHRKRNIVSKFIEILTALKLESMFTKKEIFRIYLNLLPYGSNIEGVETACYYYFHKPVSQISLSQAAMLTIIPNSPNVLNPVINPEALENKKNRVLKRLKEQGIINEEKYHEGIGEKIAIDNPGMPFLALHFTDLIHRRYRDESFVVTTLSFQIQRKAEDILKSHLDKWKKRGITNGAVVIIGNKNHELLGMVGSYDFYDSFNDGQVNGALASRSPGSTLKPLLYAYGINQGIVTPSTRLSDVPVNYGEYSPENYDGKYHGLVSVREALRTSMNVPAVNLLAKVGGKNFGNLLNQCGVTTIDLKKREYGLSLILGGCEVNLLELTNLYSVFANRGLYRPVCFTKGETEIQGKRLFSEGTAFILSEMLSDVTRPDLPEYWEYTRDMPKVAWKTGTSYGHRDAWSIGYTRNYTVGVWVGNFDGSGVPELVGSQVAAPVLFDVLRSIIGEDDRIWFKQPPSVKKREICALSGRVPNPDCPHTKEEYYIPGISSEGVCDIHQVFYIDKKTGYRLTKEYMEGRKCIKKVYEIYPPDVATWMERNNFPIQKVPELDPGFRTLLSGKGPVINSPNEECTYIIREGIPLEYQKIPLDASVPNTVRKIYWFLDGKLIWSGHPIKKTYIYPERGKHILVCQDDHGRSMSMELKIK